MITLGDKSGALRNYSRYIHLRGRLMKYVVHNIDVQVQNFILRARWLMINWGLACFGSQSSSKYFAAIHPSSTYLLQFTPK